MKPINIYALTRIKEESLLGRMERQMSKRSSFIKIKTWEMDCLREVAEALYLVDEHLASYCYYYSFTMPKLGKEFDLLRISDEIVVNIELKSGMVSDETIRKQLLQNRHYLATLGKTVYSYTYVSSAKRLIRLSNGENLIDTDWEELAHVLQKQTNLYEEAVEELFREDSYLISPLTDPGRFLRKEYFLTSQQLDIKRHILKEIQKEQTSFHGITGLPGTGKTLVLYDLAMHLSYKANVCVLHMGVHAPELEQLNERLRRVDFYSGKDQDIEWKALSDKNYRALLVDDGQRLTERVLGQLKEVAKEWKIPVIISYNVEESISQKERLGDGANIIEQIPDIEVYRLTNRIRVNSELSTFNRCVMCCGNGSRRKEYPSVHVSYANNMEELAALSEYYRQKDFTYLSDRTETSKEYDRVIMLVDATFYYDEENYLRCTKKADNISNVRKLYHGLSRAKLELAIIVLNNPSVFEKIISIVQTTK